MSKSGCRPWQKCASSYQVNSKFIHAQAMYEADVSVSSRAHRPALHQCTRTPAYPGSPFSARTPQQGLSPLKILAPLHLRFCEQLRNQHHMALSDIAAAQAEFDEILLNVFVS